MTELNDAELGTLLIGATRDALPRYGYIVRDVCDLLVTHWPELPERARAIIKREVEEAFLEYEAFTEQAVGAKIMPLGGASDRAEWRRVRGLYR